MKSCISKPAVLRSILRENDYIISPCAYDALSAKMIEAVGFKVIGTSGFGMHAAMLGVPDNGMLAFNEMADALSKMVDAVSIPIMADGEAGYGNAINVLRTVRTFEKAGLGGMFIEDQKLPPNCPFVKQTQTVSVDEMCGKIRAAVSVRTDSDFVIVARSDAPYEEAIDRAAAYIEAGADMIKIAPRTRRQLEELPERVNAPLHVGFDGGTEVTEGLTAWDAGKMGYKIITFPTAALFAGLQSMKHALEEILRTGTDREIMSRMMSIDEFLTFVGKDKYYEIEKQFLRA